MKQFAKKTFSRFPFWAQQSLKKNRYNRQVKQDKFVTNEPEFYRLENWVRPGDFVVDAGSNIGHYTARLSNIVGPEGRVFAFEPMPSAFEILTSIVSRQGNNNTSLFNCALSDSARFARMEVPLFDTGLVNTYMASIADTAVGQGIYCVPFDSLDIKERIAFAKIDVEEHELSVLRGMRKTIERDLPVLVIEGRNPEIESFLSEFGYGHQELPGSPNRIFIPQDRA